MSMSSLLHGNIALLLQQQLIGQLLETGQDASLAETLLRGRHKNGREIAAEALTGRIRSDSGMLRQSSRNLLEGGAIAEIAREGVGSIIESLQKMHDLTQEMANGTAASGAAAAYADHAAEIKGIVASTAYNGISLMDKTRWGADERLTLSGSGNAASLSIQAGNSARSISLADFSDVANASPLNTPLDALNAASLASELSVLIKNARMHEKSYASLAASMASEAKSIERQSDILDLTAARAITGTKTDPASQLLYFLLSDQGKLIDGKS